MTENTDYSERSLGRLEATSTLVRFTLLSTVPEHPPTSFRVNETTGEIFSGVPLDREKGLPDGDVTFTLFVKAYSRGSVDINFAPVSSVLFYFILFYNNVNVKFNLNFNGI